MTKYWNPRRLRRIKERTISAEKRALQKAAAERKRVHSYTPGETKKNVGLMLDALGLPLRRRMLARLRQEGAMSVSKLAKPFRITLPSALAHVRMLERSSVIATHKRGRIRMCIYNPKAMKEFGSFLETGAL